MTDTNSKVAVWCREKLLDHEDILGVSIGSSRGLVLSVKDLPAPVSVAVMSEQRVEMQLLPDEFNHPETEFLLNVPKDAFISGEVLSAAAAIPLGVGGLGDLYRAANDKEFRNYIPPEPSFLLRALGQHTAVREIFRSNDRTYSILKHTGDVVCVLALNDYDLTGEAVRSGIDKYGVPEFILASNPNCRVSSASKDIARSAGTGVLTLKQLMGALNN